MVYFAPVFLIIISYSAGELICSIFRNVKKNPIEKCLIGTFFVIVSWGIMAQIEMRQSGSFRNIALWYSVLLITILILSIVFTHKNIQNDFKCKKPIEIRAVIVASLILLLQILAIIFVCPDTEFDYTLETVNTTLVTDSMYEYHPGMGQLIEYEITSRGKLVTLPLFYAYLSAIFDKNSIELVYRAIPIWGILLNFMCYSLWADGLLEESPKKLYKKMMFLVGLGILNLGGLFVNESVFYYIMEKGFRGESLCYNVIIPFIIYEVFKTVNSKKYTNCVYIILAIASSICLADIQTGLVPSLCCTFVALLIGVIHRVRRWIICKK